MKQIDLTKLGINELKALVYDKMALREQNERELQFINQEIKKRYDEQEVAKETITKK